MQKECFNTIVNKIERQCVIRLGTLIFFTFSDSEFDGKILRALPATLQDFEIIWRIWTWKILSLRRSWKYKVRHWKRNRLWLLVWAEVRIKDRLTWKLDRSDVSNIKIVSECRRHYLIIFIWFISGKKRNSIFQRVISIKIFFSLYS